MTNEVRSCTIPRRCPRAVSLASWVTPQPWSFWCRAFLIATTLSAAYLVTYGLVRAAHFKPDGRLAIATSSRLANVLFFPVMRLEQSLRDRPVADPGLTLQSLLAESRNTHRPVLVVLGTPSCLPCRQLEHFLELQAAIVSKYFVVTKANLDGDYSLGALISQRFRTKVDTEGYTAYFPWILFLNEDGEVLVTADSGSPGVIGIPQGSAQDRQWFVEMLRIANPQITDHELAQISQAAAKYHEEIWNAPQTQR